MMLSVKGYFQCPMCRQSGLLAGKTEAEGRALTTKHFRTIAAGFEYAPVSKRCPVPSCETYVFGVRAVHDVATGSAPEAFKCAMFYPRSPDQDPPSTSSASSAPKKNQKRRPPPLKKRQAPEKEKEGPWACSQCTCSNPSMFLQCRACRAKKGPSNSL